MNWVDWYVGYSVTVSGEKCMTGCTPMASRSRRLVCSSTVGDCYALLGYLARVRVGIVTYNTGPPPRVKSRPSRFVAVAVSVIRQVAGIVE